MGEDRLSGAIARQNSIFFGLRGSALLGSVLLSGVVAGCTSTALVGDPCITSRECPGLVCDVDRAECVQCLANPDCLDEQVCSGKRCGPRVSCDTSRECPDQVCDLTHGYCVDCVVDIDCLAEGNVCRSNLCVAAPQSCRSDRECSGAGLVCDPEANQCVECVRDMDCTDTERCRADHRCVRAMDGGVDAGAGDDAGSDAGHDAGGEDAGTPDAGPEDDAGAPACDAPAASNLVITEVMIASASGSGDLGEWFELENRSSCAIDLTGVSITSPDNGGIDVTHVISGGTVPAGARFVFAESGNSSENHGLIYDYIYGAGSSGVVLNNGADRLILHFEGREIDRVEWTASVAGTARQLDPDFVDTDNRALDGPGYCAATAIYSSTAGGPYRGSPGVLNDDC